MQSINHSSKRQVFIVGAKSLGAYGGYETFLNKLTEYHQDNPHIQYHIACKANGDGHMDESKLENVTKLSEDEFLYHNARCFKIKVPNIGPAQAILYDVQAMQACIKYMQLHQIKNAIVYILACRIGPFMPNLYKRLQQLGAEIYVNPDGHEWMRAKWNKWIRKYWKWSESLMVKYSDLLVCDSINIEKYIHKTYDGKGRKGSNPKTTYIAYGAETRPSKLADTDLTWTEWYTSKGLTPNNYYLVVGRFVPENNYEIMLREFMQSKTKKDFALITNVNEHFLAELESRLHFQSDPRIKFVGTVYEPELLMKIRENAFAYLHGHEVGGTNPSLLEALGSTKLNLLLDVGFNREVAEDAAVYWGKGEGELADLLETSDSLVVEEIENLGRRAKSRIQNAYSWAFIANSYSQLWGEFFSNI